MSRRRPVMRSMRKGLLLPAMVLVLLGLTAGVVYATAWSTWGFVMRVNSPGYGYSNACARAGIVDVADNKSQVRVYSDGQSCGVTKNLPSGYIAAKADGYRNGAYCSTTGWYFNSVTAAYFAVGQVICSNPAGTQTFNTVGWGGLWNGSSYPANSRTSPSQNY